MYYGRTNSRFVSVLLFLVFLAVSFSFVPAFAEVETRGSVSTGETSPDFSIPMTDGSTFTLYDHGGAIILINQWSNT